MCFFAEAACVPLLWAVGPDPTGDPQRPELLPGVSTAHPSSGLGSGGPSGWRDPHGWLLQRGFHQWRERWVELCWAPPAGGVRLRHVVSPINWQEFLSVWLFNWSSKDASFSFSDVKIFSLLISLKMWYLLRFWTLGQTKQFEVVTLGPGGFFCGLTFWKLNDALTNNSQKWKSHAHPRTFIEMRSDKHHKCTQMYNVKGLFFLIIKEEEEEEEANKRFKQ